MTKEEFNKLSQQEKLNLVGEKWFSLYNADKEYGWFIERTYTKDKEGKKQLLSESCCLNVQPPFDKYFDDLKVWLSKDRCGSSHICYKNGGITFSIGTIPNGFLEDAYFMEIPKSSVNEIIDEYYLDNFNPFETLCTDYRRVEEICKTKETKETKQCVHLNDVKRPLKFWDNPKIITKVNIALICIAVLITLINIWFFYD